ncbi:hypothetical protein BDV96DRAFT_44614 [Lophiotrema nucula]|uniref:Azaphilone pigments biosynthesis cluster protein L N-terminal domain-containing protein n=1 Tax=Lophiotrema nucula TaxID=690887 RepID=A0A6A5ZCK9_9PLEO|nr:hypothetical protein BDV96DRAFT_44614 [Lophiotrema nucula]
MDPLSITASVLTLIQVSVQVTVLIKQFRDEVSVVDVTLSGLLNDVESFQRVLESMRETFGQDDVKANLQETGHVGSHYRNLARSLNDGNGTLNSLHELLDSVNKKSNFLDGPRKQLRFKSATDQIATYREQIQSYRAGMQLSLSTVILWNQVTFQKSTDQIPDRILPNLDKLYDEFRSLGTNLNAKIEKLQSMVSDQSDRQELTSLNNLRDCVRSAADVVSTASTTLTAETSDKISVKYGSDFGDIFTHTQNETMLRWMNSNTVYEFEDMEAPMPIPSESSIGDAPTEYQSDSDSDIENEMIKALLNNGLKRKEQGDLAGAERHFKNCITRLSTNSSVTSLSNAAAAANSGVSKAEVLEYLTQTYCLQQAWAKAKVTMMEKLHITERQVGKKDERFLQDTMKLAEVMMSNKEYGDAHLQARRALRGFKKLGELGHKGYEQCLRLLMHLSKEEGKFDEEEGYSALLGSHLFKLKRSSISETSLTMPPQLERQSKSFSSEPSRVQSTAPIDEKATTPTKALASNSEASESPVPRIDAIPVKSSKQPSSPQTRTLSDDALSKPADQMPYPPAAGSIARKSAVPVASSSNPLVHRKDNKIDEALARRLQEQEFNAQIEPRQPTSPSRNISRHDASLSLMPGPHYNSFSETLGAQLDDLRSRRFNVQHLLSDLNRQEPADPLINDFKRMRLVEQRKKEFEDELAAIVKEEHDVELKLHRAEKREQERAASTSSPHLRLERNDTSSSTLDSRYPSSTGHSNDDERLAKRLQETEETLALGSSSSLPLLRSENPDEALARRLQREEFSASNPHSSVPPKGTLVEPSGTVNPQALSTAPPVQSPSPPLSARLPQRTPSLQSPSGDKKKMVFKYSEGKMRLIEPSTSSSPQPDSKYEATTTEGTSATLANAASFLQELPSITVVPATTSFDELREELNANGATQDTSLRRSVSDSRLTNSLGNDDVPLALSSLDTLAASARNMDVGMNSELYSELSERYNRLQRIRSASASTLAPPEPTWSPKTGDDEVAEKAVVKLHEQSEKEVVSNLTKDKTPDWVGHTREEVVAAIGHGQSITRPGWNLDKTISRNDAYATDPYAAAKIDITPSCPICSANLCGLSDTAASTHVNSCMDGKPIAVSKLREMDKGQSQMTTLQRSQNLLSAKEYARDDGVLPVTSVPAGTWACCNCKSLELRFISESKCPTCGHTRDFTCPSSAGPAIGVTFITANLGPVRFSQGERVRRKLLILGDTKVGKTWLIQSWYKGQHPAVSQHVTYDYVPMLLTQYRKERLSSLTTL